MKDINGTKVSFNNGSFSVFCFLVLVFVLKCFKNRFFRVLFPDPVLEFRGVIISIILRSSPIQNGNASWDRIKKSNRFKIKFKITLKYLDKMSLKKLVLLQS